MDKKYYVYHIACEGRGLDEGYVGVSCEPVKRWSRHKSVSSDSNPHLINAIKKYNPDFKIIAVFDTEYEALWQEFTLRPKDRMGWNLTRGGGRPPYHVGTTHPSYGKVTSEETKKKQSIRRTGRYGGRKHPGAKPANIYDRYTNEIVAEDIIIQPWAKANGYHQAHLSATATGKLKYHKGIYARYIK